MNTKDFYIDTYYLCGIRSSDNIFDLPKDIFESGDFIQFEEAIKSYIKPASVTLYLWPWMWQSSDLTDEVYIYNIETNRILYHNQMKEFFDARMVRKEQTLQGCEVFDFKFQFPKMLNTRPVIAKAEKEGNFRSMTILVK